MGIKGLTKKGKGVKGEKWGKMGKNKGFNQKGIRGEKKGG